jgi:hypothetical protein
MGVSQRVTRNSPETLLGTDPSNPGYIDPRHTEFDSKGQNVGTVTSYVQQPGGPSEPPIPIEGQSPLYIDGQRANVTLNGLPMSAQEVAAYVNTVGVGGMMGLTQTLMGQFDFRFKNVQLRSTYDANRWHNFGSDMAGAISRAGEFAGPMTIRARLNLGFSASRFTTGIPITNYYRIIKTAQGHTLRFKDKEAFLRLFKSVLDSGDCKAKLNELLKEIGATALPGQELVANDIEALFSDINGQQSGGFFMDRSMDDAYNDLKSVNNLDDETARKVWPAGGGGVTFRKNTNVAERHVYIFPRAGWYKDTYDISGTMQRFAYGDFVRTVHESFHAAGKSRSFRHEQMDAAAKKLGSSGFTAYVEKYCLPEKLRSGLK